MFEDREPSIFPHPASAWWVAILLAVGWGPLLISDILYPKKWEAAEGFGMPWGIAVALPCTLLAALSLPIQIFRLLIYLLNRPRKSLK
jgi:hypothetical protein